MLGLVNLQITVHQSLAGRVLQCRLSRTDWPCCNQPISNNNKKKKKKKRKKRRKVCAVFPLDRLVHTITHTITQSEDSQLCYASQQHWWQRAPPAELHIQQPLVSVCLTWISEQRQAVVTHTSAALASTSLVPSSAGQRLSRCCIWILQGAQNPLVHDLKGAER